MQSGQAWVRSKRAQGVILTMVSKKKQYYNAQIDKTVMIHLGLATTTYEYSCGALLGTMRWV
jgi:hypothetical protein